MSQNTNSIQIILQGSLMGANINAIGKSAYNEYVGITGGQLINQFTCDATAVIGGIPGTYNADHFLPV